MKCFLLIFMLPHQLLCWNSTDFWNRTFFNQTITTKQLALSLVGLIGLASIITFTMSRKRQQLQQNKNAAMENYVTKRQSIMRQQLVRFNQQAAVKEPVLGDVCKTTLNFIRSIDNMKPSDKNVIYDLDHMSDYFPFLHKTIYSCYKKDVVKTAKGEEKIHFFLKFKTWDPTRIDCKVSIYELDGESVVKSYDIVDAVRKRIKTAEPFSLMSANENLDRNFWIKTEDLQAVLHYVPEQY